MEFQTNDEDRSVELCSRIGDLCNGESMVDVVSAIVTLLNAPLTCCEGHRSIVKAGLVALLQRHDGLLDELARLTAETQEHEGRGRYVN